MNNRKNRKHRVVSKVKAVSPRARLFVYRSNRYIYAQVIEAVGGSVVAAASEKQLKTNKGSKSERAREVGRMIAELTLAKKTKQVVLVRGHYRYHGRVKAVAEGAREKGLEF